MRDRQRGSTICTRGTLLRGVISSTDIENYCAAIAREFRPRKIVVFGSYAYGTPTRDSDLDLLVVMPKRKRDGVRPSLAIRRRVPARFAVDILVRPPGEVSRRLRDRDSFMTEVMSRDRIMYEAGHA